MVGQLLGWGSAFLSLVTTLSDGDKDIKDAKKTLDMAGRAYNVLNTSSVSVSAGRAIVSPITLFESNLMHQEFMTDLLTIVNMRDIRDALIHINFQSTIGGVKIGSLVDSINPNRTSGFLCYQGVEAFYAPPNSVANTTKKEDKNSKNKDEKGDPVVTISGKQYADLSEYEPLAIGRTVDATVSYDGKPASFPITFRQIPIPAPTNNIKLVFEAAKNGEPWKARVKSARFGEITVPELLTGVDEIKRRFRILDNDTSGYIKEVNDRATRSILESIKTGIVSVNEIANTIIITNDTANAIESEIGIKFGSSRMDQIRKHVKANTIVVVNQDHGVFIFYSLSSNMPEKYTYDQIKTKVKKENTGSLDSLIKLLNGR